MDGMAWRDFLLSVGADWMGVGEGVGVGVGGIYVIYIYICMLEFRMYDGFQRKVG